MPEIKNTFIKSKMNKDLDSRLIPKGEYRDGINISVSTSEGDSVGSLENIRGNTFLSDFGLTDRNLEILGHYEDEVNDRIFIFITNYNDTSYNGETQSIGDVSSTSSSKVRTGSRCYIAYYNLLDGSNDILVSGAFLNFSKTHPICGVNLIEDLLFWTDNRNQPRKINVSKAIANPETYYTKEDHISVAKYAPWESISFLKETNGYKELTLINEKDEWLPPIISTVFSSFRSGTGSVLELVNDYQNTNAVANPTYQAIAANFDTTLLPGVTWPATYEIKITNVSRPDSPTFYVKAITVGSGATSGEEFFTIAEGFGGAFPALTFAQLPSSWVAGDVFVFQIKNPYYDSGFELNDRDSEFLRDKFMRFSYRFQYDDDEFSLMAPFSEVAFRPKQYGYFLYDDDDKVAESSIVKFAENDITTVGLNIPLETGLRPNNLETELKVKKVQILSKESSSLAVKVIDELDTEDLKYGIPNGLSISSGGTGYSNGVETTTGGSGTGLEVNITTTAGVITGVSIDKSGEGYLQGDVVSVAGGSGGTVEITILDNVILYNYKSTKPIKVLDEKEITRVSDIVPLKAKTQEAVGNRIIYGNFLQNKRTPDSLNYQVNVIEKPYPFASLDKQTAKQFPNHTLKQNRTYQVGVVLVDRYGRTSNVILSEDEQSSIFSRYTDGGSDPRSWFGNSLRVTFLDGIPSQKTNEYQGIYNENLNPLGWYTYRIVVQQKEQEYYNVYVPGALSGNIEFIDLETPLTYSNTSEIAQIALFNDNINKVPRDLKEVGPSDNIYSSSSRILYNRLKTANYQAPSGSFISVQNSNSELDEVITIRPFRELGDWTKFKGVNLHFYTPYHPGSSAASGGQFPDPTYIYPTINPTGTAVPRDPLYLKNNKNPLIATLSTESRLGYSKVNQESNNFRFSTRLTAFETKPFISNLDLYYESSMSDTISTLNGRIGSTLPNSTGLDITSWTVSLDEQTTIGSYITTEFEVSDASNSPISPGSQDVKVVSDEIYEVYNVNQLTGSQTIVRPHPFELITIAAGTPTTAPIYRVRTNQQFTYTKDSYEDHNWIIKLQVTDGTATNFIEKPVSLANVSPSINEVKWRIQDEYKPLVPYDSLVSTGDTNLIYRKDFNDNLNDVFFNGETGAICTVYNSSNGSASPLYGEYNKGIITKITRVIKRKGKWDSNTNTFLSDELIYDDTQQLANGRIGGVLGDWWVVPVSPSLSSNGNRPIIRTYPHQNAYISKSDLPNLSGRFRGAFEWTVYFVVKDASGYNDTKQSQLFNFKLVVRRKT